MKTKPIFASLLILFACLAASIVGCICPQETSPAQASHASLNSSFTSLEMHGDNCTANGDLCQDCGHTNTCCVEHSDLPMAGTLALNPTAIDLIQFMSVPPQAILPEAADSLLLISCKPERAPPWDWHPTLVNLNEQLLI